MALAVFHLSPPKNETGTVGLTDLMLLHKAKSVWTRRGRKDKRLWPGYLVSSQSPPNQYLKNHPMSSQVFFDNAWLFMSHLLSIISMSSLTSGSQFSLIVRLADVCSNWICMIPTWGMWYKNVIYKVNEHITMIIIAFSLNINISRKTIL